MATKKAPKTPPRFTVNKGAQKILIAVAIVVVLLALGFVLRGWARTTVIPKMVSVVRLHGVQATLDQESSKLQDPLARLGFNSVTKTSACHLQLAQSIHTQVDCSVVKQAYAQLPSGAAAVANTQKQAALLQTQLLAEGWRSGSNGVTLSGLINGTAKGVDYSPDAYYEKVVGGTDCTFDTMIAYSNPHPPALRSSLACDKTVDFLGAPHNEFYNSAKGHY